MFCCVVLPEQLSFATGAAEHSRIIRVSAVVIVHVCCSTLKTFVMPPDFAVV